jgi:hypothetical protein
MKRDWNWPIWVGFAVALLAVFTYEPVFLRFPITRDFPWVNLLLMVVSLCLLVAGLRRAFGSPGKYRGNIAGPILTFVSVALFGLFCFVIFYATRIPAPEGALRPGQHAPDFTLTATDGKPVTLSELRTGKRAVLLIFYRGYW